MNNIKIKIGDEVYIKCEYIPGTGIKTVEKYPTLFGIINHIYNDGTININSEIDNHVWDFESSDISPVYKRSEKLYYDSGEFRPAKKGEYFIDKNDPTLGSSHVFKRLSPNPLDYSVTILKPIFSLTMRKKEIQQQYKILKPITIATIIDAGDTGCFTFRNEVAELFKILLTNNISFIEELQINFLEGCFKDNPRWCNWLIEESFIEKIPQEIFYHVGQEFKLNGWNETWQLMVCNNNLAFLCCTKGCYKGQSWDGKIYSISNREKITKTEFKNITNNRSSEFTPIPDT